MYTCGECHSKNQKIVKNTSRLFDMLGFLIRGGTILHPHPYFAGSCGYHEDMIGDTSMEKLSHLSSWTVLAPSKCEAVKGLWQCLSLGLRGVCQLEHAEMSWDVMRCQDDAPLCSRPFPEFQSIWSPWMWTEQGRLGHTRPELNSHCRVPSEKWAGSSSTRRWLPEVLSA